MGRFTTKLRIWKPSDPSRVDEAEPVGGHRRQL